MIIILYLGGLFEWKTSKLSVIIIKSTVYRVGSVWSDQRFLRRASAGGGVIYDF